MKSRLAVQPGNVAGQPRRSRERNRAGFKFRMGYLLLAMALSLLLPLAASGNVVIDEWGEPAIFVNANSTAGFDVITEDGPIATGVLGGWRRIRVENTGEAGNVFFNIPVPSDERDVAEAGETSTAQGGRQTVIWDGAAGPRINNDPNEDLIPITFDQDDNVTDGLNFDLGGVNLTNACTTNATPGIAVLVRVDQAVTVPFTLKLFTAADEWSSLTVNVPPGAARPLFIADFPLASFVARGDDGASGADFEDVNAIVLLSETNNADEDIDFFQIQSCGFDFGDAPEAGLADRYYTTTLAVKDDLSVDPDFFVRNNTGPGPRHRLIAPGPFLGTGVNDTDSEPDGQPNATATGDDGDGYDDEQAIDSFPAMGEEPGVCDGLEILGDLSLYCVAIEVSNPTNTHAQVVGWIDFSGGGVFSHAACGTSADGKVLEDRLGGSFGTGWGCDRSAAGVRLGATGFSQIDSGGPACPSGSSAGTPIQDAVEIGGGTWTTGNVPPNCEGTVVLVWDLSEATQVTEGETFGRFRITTDSELTTFFDEVGPAPFGEAGDGEVEDHRLAPGEVPVTIHAFQSEFVDAGLRVTWGTASESKNVGFHLWADFGSGLVPVTETMIPSYSDDLARPAQYEYFIPDVRPGGVGELVVSAVDVRGNEDVFGVFEAGQEFGRPLVANAIAWQQVREETRDRMRQRSITGISGALSPVRGTPSVNAADVIAMDPGMQRVRFADLVRFGLDLSAVNPEHVAVSLNGQPVERQIVQLADGGLALDFWGEKPTLPDALYVRQYHYRISVDPALAVPARSTQMAGGSSPDFHLARVAFREDNLYHASNPLDNPWYTARLRANHSTDTFSTTLNVERSLFPGQEGLLRVTVGGLTDFPAFPNHHVEVSFNGQPLEEVFFTGQVAQVIETTVPADLINVGENTVTVRLPGGTPAAVDIVLLDSIELLYPTMLAPDSDRLLVEQVSDSASLTAIGFTTEDTVAYAWRDGALSALEQQHFGRGSVRVPAVGEGASYWISSASRLHTPRLAIPVPELDLLNTPADFLVIAHPAFMPLSPQENHPLNTYLQQRQSDGWSVALFDISQIQMKYTNGMPLPQALTRFLADADQAFGFSHVLLVGSDSYDYHDNLGLGSVSFIPTVYAATNQVRHTPSDGLLADLSGDGVADKAIGRWPVRTQGDLQAIVTKTLDWANRPDQPSAIWMTDFQDSNLPSFTSQAERMIGPLVDGGWMESNIGRVYLDEIAGMVGGNPQGEARQQFFDLLEQGHSMTGFIGHGSAWAWSNDVLVAPQDIGQLNNDGSPTLIGTLTCYTSYFVSPYSDTVAHRWMNGFRLDGHGNQVPGAPNGAVAIHGAATLSNYAQNEIYARTVLQHQLDGKTLGEAVLEARRYASDRNISDLVTNWILLGDPTLTIQ